MNPLNHLLQGREKEIGVIQRHFRTSCDQRDPLFSRI